MKYYYLLASLALSGLIACSGDSKKESDEEGSIETVLPDLANEVTITSLQTGNFYHELISNGKLSASRYAELVFQSSEPIAKIYVKNGDRVAKGQKLAELSTFRLANQTIQSKADMENARLEMQDLLIGQGYALADSASVPQSTMDLVRTKSGYNRAISSYQVARYEEENAVLTAPFDGIIANLFDKEYNTASTSEAFCMLIDSRTMEAVFTVLESELPLIRNGERVMISPFSMPDVAQEGRITEINPLVDEKGMVTVKAQVANNGKLFEGMNVRISVQRSVPDQLVVPKEAVVLRSGKQVVFTLVNDRAYWNYVQTGLENAGHYTITEGLKDGDIVIVSGNINLAHEAPVTIIEN